MEFKSEDWKHTRCRAKNAGMPVYDEKGDKWVCSKCELGLGSGYGTYETALETFWLYAAWTMYSRVDGATAPVRGVSEEQERLIESIKLGYELLRANGHKDKLLDQALCRFVGTIGDYQKVKAGATGRLANFFVVESDFAADLKGASLAPAGIPETRSTSLF